MIFSFKVSFFDLWGSEAKYGQERDGKQGLPRALSKLVCTFHRFCHTWLVVLNFLGEKACSSFTNREQALWLLSGGQPGGYL